jgi:tryptophan-rich sensory protein
MMGMTELASKNQLRMSFARWAVVVVPLFVLLGGLSGLLSNSGMDNQWYAQLLKPEIMPPGWAFGVVWTTLYTLMGLAVASILDARGANGRALALGLFAVQFLLNLGWSPVFFGAHQAHAAVFLLIAILLVATITVFAFAPIRRYAAWLLVPYLAWLTVALALAYQIDVLNPNAAHLGRVAGTAHINS